MKVPDAIETEGGRQTGIGKGGGSEVIGELAKAIKGEKGSRERIIIIRKRVEGVMAEKSLREAKDRVADWKEGGVEAVSGDRLEDGTACKVLDGSGSYTIWVAGEHFDIMGMKARIVSEKAV